MYYALILISVIMFGGNFALSDVYRKMRGSGLKISLESSLIGSLAGLAVLVIINGFQFELTPFTLVMALLSALNSLGFTFCSFRALEHINLSLFSLFSMLGGMVLPFLQGILFYKEDITVAKVVCFLFIFAALLMTVTRGDDKKKGMIYYAGIFILNGMSGVITKIYTSAPFPKADAAGYSSWIALCTAALSALLLPILFRGSSKSDPPFTRKAVGICALHGIVGKVANFVLVIALAHVDASVQYPMVTGGTMIVSSLICLFGDRKPSKKEIFSVILAFIGTLALFVIPI